MMDDTRLDKYFVYVKFIVLGEYPEDAVDYVNHAIDNSDLLDQDGIVGIEFAEEAHVLDEGDYDEYTDSKSNHDTEY